jgi:hypothetical protein
MSISIVHHVREKSQSKGSARTLLLNLAIYANNCCGVAWPSDATLHRDVNVSRQRIHELKNSLEAMGELVIVERPGSTNLYFVAWQGNPLGGTFRDTGHHDPCCPLRHPRQAARCASAEVDGPTGPEEQEGSEIPDPQVTLSVSETPDPQESEISDGGSQNFLTQKTRENYDNNTSAPAMTITLGPQAPPPSIPPKAEQASPFWCQACGAAIPACKHRVVYGTARGRFHWVAPSQR